MATYEKEEKGEEHPTLNHAPRKSPLWARVLLQRREIPLHYADWSYALMVIQFLRSECCYFSTSVLGALPLGLCCCWPCSVCVLGMGSGFKLWRVTSVFALGYLLRNLYHTPTRPVENPPSLATFQHLMGLFGNETTFLLPIFEI